MTLFSALGARLRCVLLLSTVFILSCSSWDQRFASHDAIIKSPQDTRDFRYLRLSNGLPVLLLSDPLAEKAAVSLDVFVGSRHNPKDREGLAHFLEHMLFLGTAKYPNPDEYQQFISENGGSHNAFTAFEHTNYFFDIDASKLDEALDRFADFFVSPLFNQDYVQREMHAIESEYRARIKNEQRRINDASKALINPDHPAQLFSVGSLETLSDRPSGKGDASQDNAPIREQMRAFYQQHYSASKMALVVISNQSLDALTAMVKDRFALIENNQSKVDTVSQSYYADNAQRLLVVKPDKPLRQLHLSFEMPDLSASYQSKPLQYIGNILGHEGKGSLLSYLKAQGLADSLGAGMGRQYQGGGTFDINIGLTEKGLQHIDLITAAFFNTVQLIEQGGVEEWRFWEQAKLANLSFQFLEPTSTSSTAIHLATNLHHYPAKAVMYADYDYTHFDEGLILKVLSKIKPQTLRMKIVAQDLPEQWPTNSMSSRFFAEYDVYNIPAKWLDLWSDTSSSYPITLPKKNPFIPNDLALYAQKPVPSNARPSLLEEVDGYRLWALVDDEFNVPKGDVFISLQSAIPRQSAKNKVLSELYVRVISEQLNEYLYPARLAGMSTSFYSHLRGFTLKISGYNDSSEVLLDSVISGLHTVTIDEARFNDLKNHLLRSWMSAQKSVPYKRLSALASQALYKNVWSEDALIEAASSVTLDQLVAFIEQVQHDVLVDVLLHGNYSSESIQGLNRLAKTLSQCDAEHAQCKRERRQHIGFYNLEEGSQWFKSVQFDHSDIAAYWYYQGQNDSIQEVANVFLSSEIIHPLFYADLRTQQQLGYIVYTRYSPLHKFPGMVFQVQSPNASGPALAEAINTFKLRFLNELVSEELFNKTRNGLVLSLRERDSNMNQRSQRYWYYIALGERDFDRNEKIAQALEALTYTQWQQFIQRFLGADKASLLLGNFTYPVSKNTISGKQRVRTGELPAAKSLPAEPELDIVSYH